MSASYGRLQILVCPPGSRVTQLSSISQFNTGGRVRGFHGRGSRQGGRDYGCGPGRGHGRGGRLGRGGRIYDQNPYEFASRNRKLESEARVYPVDQCILLSFQQKNNIQEMKFLEGWRGFDVAPKGYKQDNEGNPVVDQSFLRNLNFQFIQVSASGNSLVPMPPSSSVPPPIPPFLITGSSTFVQPFDCQSISQQR